MSDLRRNNRHPLFAFPRTNLCCAECLSLILYIVNFWLPSPHVHVELLLSDETSPEPERRRPIGWGGETSYCKCTRSMLCLIITCNVAALTFYATIYEDICCTCNKCREKHVLGTASTAGSLCLLALSRPEATISNHSLIKHS